MSGTAPPPPPTPGDPLAQVLGLGTLDDKQALLQQQLEQAQALQGKPQGQYYGALGGLFGGLNHSLQDIAGVVKENRLRPQMDALLKEKEKGRQAYGAIPGFREGLLKAMLPTPPPAPDSGLQDALLKALLQQQQPQPQPQGAPPGAGAPPPMMGPTPGQGPQSGVLSPFMLGGR